MYYFRHYAHPCICTYVSKTKITLGRNITVYVRRSRATVDGLDMIKH